MVRKVVIDASAVLSYLLPNETATTEIKNLFNEYSKGNIQFISPNLLKIEVANAIRTAVLRGRMGISVGKKMIKAFLSLEITYTEIDINDTLDFALKNKLTVYDACYAITAKKAKTKLVTLDKDLLAIKL